ALEFLAVKVIFELKKSLDRMASGTAHGTTAMGSTPVGMGGFGMTPPPQTMAHTAQMPGRPPSIISAAAFNAPGALPTPDPSLLPQKSTGPSCTSCGASIRPNAKFCTKCGSKLQ
ncbi:MAG: zinc-ribbon domain-containing protein, partial [Thermoproteota archaeon]